MALTRARALQEELNELKEAIEQKDLVEVADALADLQYVLSGAVHEFGMGSVRPCVVRVAPGGGVSGARATRPATARAPGADRPAPRARSGSARSSTRCTARTCRRRAPRAPRPSAPSSTTRSWTSPHASRRCALRHPPRRRATSQPAPRPRAQAEGKFLVYRIADSKVLKSVDYSPADLAAKLGELDLENTQPNK